MTCTAAPLTLRLYGEPAIALPDGRSVALERRAAAVLALVALEPGISRLRVAALLWPDSNDPRRNLRQQLLRFRQQFGQPLVEGESTLTLDGALAVESPADPGSVLLAGQHYEDCEAFEAWLSERREALRHTQRELATQQLADSEAAGRLDEALAIAGRLLSADPDSELHHRTLMRLHYLRGDVAQAQAAYERLVRHLKTDLGALPSAETEELARVLRSAAVPVRTAPRAAFPTLLRPPRLIGRERELAAVHEAWVGGGVVLLQGEAGMGKSRLIAELARVRRLAVVQGRPGDAGIPYATLARLLRESLPRAIDAIAPDQRRELARVLPELAPAVPLPAEGQRLVLHSAVRQVLAGAAVEAAAVDDLHFADDASIEMLLALAGEGRAASEGGESGEGASAKLLWLFAQRPAEGSAAAVLLHDTLQEAGTLRRVALEPLDESAMAALIDSLGLPELDGQRLAGQLVRHTGGNPLFALETLKQALGTQGLGLGQLPRPASVGGLIERRLRQLSERALALARVAAVAGVDFSIALAEEVMGARAVEFTSAFAELEAAGVLRDEAFAHDLVYEAVLRTVPPSIARHLHGAVAAHLGRSDGVAAPMAARVATHWLAANAQREALPWLAQAAQQARIGLRRREELNFLLTQAGIEESLGERASAFATLKRAHSAQLAVNDGVTGVASIYEALDRLAWTPEQRVDIDEMRATDLGNEGHYVEAEALTRRTLASARQLKYEPGCASMMSRLSHTLSMLGRLAEALAVLDECWPYVERQPDPDPSFFNDRAVLLDNLGRPREAIPLHHRVFELQQRRGDSGGALMSMGNLAVSLRECGRVRAAQRALERAEAMRRAHDQGEEVNPVMMLLAMVVDRALGCHGRALAWAERAEGPLTQSRSAHLPLVDLVRAAIWTDLGQLARARQAMPSLEALAALPPWYVARRWQFAARLREALGRDALDDVQAAAALVDDDTLPSVRESVMLHLATLRGTMPDLDTIFAIAEAARRDGRDGIALAADLRAAELAARLGMFHAAASYADRGRAVLSVDRDSDDAVTAADLSDGEAWLMLARAYAKAGREADARDAWARGADWVVRTAAEHVAPEFRESFLQRNPAHRELLAAAGTSQLADDSPWPGPMN